MGNCCLLWRELHQGEDFFEGFPEQNLKGFANVIEIFSAFRCKSLKKWWNVLIPFKARIDLFNILYFKTNDHFGAHFSIYNKVYQTMSSIS